MIIMTSYKFNSIHSLLSIREQLYILTSSTEMTDWLRSLHRIFFYLYKSRFSVRVSSYFFLLFKHFHTLYTCHRHTHTKFISAQFLLLVIHHLGQFLG